MQSLSKSQIVFFVVVDKLILEVMWKCRELRVAKTILKMKDKSGGLKFLNLKLIIRQQVTKTIWHWHQR